MNASRPIRVMQVIARMNVGGPAVQVSGLMRSLDKSQFEHRLYTGFCAADEADYLETVARDVSAFRIEGLGRRVSLRGDLKAFLFLIKEIRAFKPHVIHTHTAKAGFLGRTASMFSFHPTIRVHTFHGHLLNGYFGSFKRLLVVIAEKILAIFTDQLLAVGDKVRQDLLIAGIGKKEKFGLMPPGLVINKLPAKDESLKSFGLSSSRLQCAFIGRITQIKRPDRFLDVVSEVKKRGIDLDFFMAGDGELLEGCRKRISEQALPVTVLGWQSDIEKVLSAADIVVLTSDNEGTPVSAIQAGMAGVPTISTNVGSVAEVIKNGSTGVLTSLDPEEIATALNSLISNPDLRIQLGKNAKTDMNARYGVARLVNDYQNLYLA